MGQNLKVLRNTILHNKVTSIFISSIVTGFKLYFPVSQVCICVSFVAHVCAPSNKEKFRWHWLSFHCFPESDKYLSNKSRPRPWTDYIVRVGHQRGMCVWKVGGTYSFFKEKLLSESDIALTGTLKEVSSSSLACIW